MRINTHIIYGTKIHNILIGMIDHLTDTWASVPNPK